MDVWEWVEEVHDSLLEQGHHRLAYLIYELPSAVTADQHQRIEALYPEALALARETRNPWLEIFVRHWYLQSRVLKQLDASALSEAISLVEFSHRPEHIACPQSVCSTQDLASCYACADGPAYAPERLELAGDTLRRLTPHWSCFACVSTEYADALLESGRHQEALDFLDRQERQLKKARKDRSIAARLFRCRFWALYHLGRHTEAVAAVDRALPVLNDEHLEQMGRIVRAVVTLDNLPSLEEVEGTLAFYEPYAMALEEMVKAGRRANDLELDQALAHFQSQLVRNRGARRAFEMALRRARLALARDRGQMARTLLDEAEELMSALRAPLDAPAKLDELRSRLPAPPELPDQPDQLEVPEPPELAFELLSAAWQRWPQHPSLRKPMVRALYGTGQSRRARQLLWQWHRAEPEDTEAIAILGETLLRERSLDELCQWCDEALGGAPGAEVASWFHWIRGRARHLRKDLPNSRADLERVLALDPDAVNSRLELARVLLEMGETALGLERLLEAVKLEDDAPGPWDWDIMVHATLLKDWSLVRRHAARQQIELPEGDGAINLVWGLVDLRFEEADGSQRDWVGLRTGPVTASVLEFDRPGRPNHVGDEVVFEATPLATAEDGRPTFGVLAVRESGNAQIFVLEGVHPGEDAVEALREELRPGMLFRDLSHAGYRVGRGLPGFYGITAIFPEVTAAEAHQRLTRLTSGWEHPMLWPALAEAAGLPKVAAKQRKLAHKLGIELD